jgi:hypothetical protein
MPPFAGRPSEREEYYFHSFFLDLSAGVLHPFGLLFNKKKITVHTHTAFVHVHEPFTCFLGVC